MGAIGEGLVTIILAIVAVGLVSVLVSKNAQTPAVLQAGFSGIGNDLGVAESPVTGANIGYSLGYPSPNSLGNGFGA
jgi:hypothetical protein